MATQMWPTPQAHDAGIGNAARVGRYGTLHGGRNLNDEVAMWPTPTASQQNTSSAVSETRQRANGVCLADAARMWPTPSARDWKDGDAHSCRNVPVNALLGRAGHEAVRFRHQSLTDEEVRTQVERFPTPGGSRPHDTDEVSGRLANQIGGSLNPTWVEWLMGLPAGWTDLGA
jgi:hypothetical protein